MKHESRSRKMKRGRKAVLAAAILAALLLVVSLIIVWPSISLRRRPFSAPAVSYHSWDDIMSHPQPITIRAYSTGTMQTNLSGIMNLDHERAQDIDDEVIKIPVNVGIIQHQEFGPGHQPAGNGHHLLFAATQCACSLIFSPF